MRANCSYLLAVTALAWASVACVAGNQELYNPPGAVYQQGLVRQFFLEFDDHGFFRTSEEFDVWGSEQLDSIIQEIGNARLHGQAPVVLLFVHGWKHSAEPSNKYVRSFRHEILDSLAQSESISGRPVIAIYTGWAGSSTAVPILKQFNFFARYAAVSRIGNGSDFQYSLRRIARITRGDDPDTRGLFIVAGHSMGSMMLQESLLGILVAASEFERAEFDDPSTGSTDVVGSAVPDITIFLNSAAHSLQTMKLVKHLNRQPSNLGKGGSGKCQFERPLLVSVSSALDGVTKGTFKYGRFFEVYPGGRQGQQISEPFPHDQDDYWKLTDGNNRELLTHMVRAEKDCHADEPAVVRMGELEFLRFEGEVTLCLERSSTAKAEMGNFWVLQVPEVVSAKHDDIFNPNAVALFTELVRLRLGRLPEGASCGAGSN